MSFQAMTWAVAQQCGGSSSKLALLMLANHSNGHTGQCNPRHKLLAAECEMSVETLKTHLKKLENLGLIEIVPQYAEGVQLPNHYLLKMGEGRGEIRGEGRGEISPPYNQERNLEVNQFVKEANASVAGGDVLPDCNPQAIIDLYHEALPDLPAVRLLNDQRRKAARSFWRWVLTSKKSDGSRRAKNTDQALTWIRSYFARANHNDFLMGRHDATGKHANWRADFDFLLTERGKQHVIEKTEVAA